MLQELKKEANYTLTENGALTYSSTMNHCLDLFATIGALRRTEETEIIERELLICSEISADLDKRMEEIRNRIESKLIIICVKLQSLGLRIFL